MALREWTKDGLKKSWKAQGLRALFALADTGCAGTQLFQSEAISGRSRDHLGRAS